MPGRRDIAVVEGSLERGLEVAGRAEVDPHAPPLETLTCLLRAIADLHAAAEIEEGLERVARRLGSTIPFDTFTLFLADPGERWLEASYALGLPPEVAVARRFAVGEGLCGLAALERRTQHAESDSCSELALPLMVKDRLLGVLALESCRASAFDRGSEQLLGVLASNLAIALENAALYQRLRDDERKLAEDLSAARDIHHYLLPRKTPWVPGLQTAVAYVPARHLGGDVYDFLPYGDCCTAVAVGDVAGKGTGAALYGSLAIGMLRGLVADAYRSPSSVLAQLNEELFQLGVAQRFIAMAFAVFNRSRMTLTVASSGLPFPFLLRGGEVREIDVRGLPLGIRSGVEYRERILQLEAGDVVVFTSDGIDEALDARDEPFGDARLRRALCRLSNGTAREIADGLIAATERHLDGAKEPSDDRTVVVIKVVGD